jgi:NCAIR mutase (PurE)-related protein
VKPEDLRRLLAEVASGKADVEGAMRRLETLPFEDLGYAHVDHHRALRTGAPEVVFGIGKTAEQIAGIAAAIHARGQTALVTRVEEREAKAAVALLPEPARAAASIEALPRMLVIGPGAPKQGRGTIAVVSAGTGDGPVAEEAARTAELLGNEVLRVRDVGVAGIHRLLAHRKQLEAAEVVIVVAGMEGALPSVVGGLISRPVIGVPTSIGYGASFGGLSALLAMLNSCAAGITVVNIDNGFGAGFAASVINAPHTERAG